ncbi:unnamed protein product [Arabidopsis lyrata]|uniref:Cysteine-rich transmembrane domain-containing protein n=2 Tax=Arabidopsis TaxID=3701 RepID=D7KNV1_ARALL|nr:cysteine-rich and transmembrane domain-containing protein A [Arabidopsis lyrata subsp. lyrata]EFH70812.1 hypothetical protein ARALYDRAFT_474673 [Arabidopsis lyrata subsp. lyrata]KAG7595344.1 Cysteine-rich transmembrane CYSTM domain [Arabidopsis thaliana x Arabidopsis arenosa]CAH8255748.1 unnamed protein product [Arabidopsis lyrata]|eukprot:XP_020869954.1 cysteine-rich and transmembrane domain-containing protein A [Arabidopsis lyrata subsp. lyrata]
MAQYHQQHEMKQTMTETPYVTAPPPMGYPVMKKESPQTVQPPHQTQSKGTGGFLRGCLAAMCCCCVLDCVF